MLFKGFNQDNIHHAYFIEGSRSLVLDEILDFLKLIKFNTSQNPDFVDLSIDVVKVEDARNIKSLSLNKSSKGKKVFIISANNFLPEAQNVLLKVFEDPTPETHFFLILPERGLLLPTLISRMHVLSLKQDGSLKDNEVENFLKMLPRARIEFVKNLLAEEQDEENMPLSSSRSKALAFLNALEQALHSKFLDSEKSIKPQIFQQIFNIRENLRAPGSSTKTLLESIALAIPNF